MRRRLLVSAALPAILAAPAAFGAEISDDRTTGVATATVEGGAPGDIVITSNGSIVLEGSSPAVRVNSDNTVTNSGDVEIDNTDNAVGILIEGGVTTTIRNAGNIRVGEDYLPEDTDNDGDLDEPVAQGTGRVGILVEGPAPVTGDIVHAAGTVAVEGNQSAAIRIADGATLDGEMRLGGSLTQLGAGSTALDVQGVVTGRVETNGSISVGGEGASAVVLAQGAQGFQNSGDIQGTGFRSTAASNYFDPDQVPAGFTGRPLDADDLLNSGPIVAVGGDLPEGFLNSGFVGGGAADDPEEGTDDVKDIRGDFDENRRRGTIRSFGSAPAVLISPDADPDGTGDLVVGLAKEVVRDTRDDDSDGDTDEVLATFDEEYGLVNRGDITASGVNIGFDANTVVISGSADGTRSTTIDGGILNAGLIQSAAREADATTIRIGAGADAGRLVNPGAIDAEVFAEAADVENGETPVQARALLIENGAALAELINTGRISVSMRGDDGDVFVIEDRSGTLLAIENTGQITAAHVDDQDDDDGDGRTNDLDERTGDEVAIDISAATGDASIVQNPSSTTEAPSITGDILMGSGNDRLEVRAGTVSSGVLAFGNGSDLLLVSGAGVSVRGEITDSDGDLAIQLDQGTLVLNNDAPLAITTATVGAEGQLRLSVGQNSVGTLQASDTVSFAEGAELLPRLGDLLVEDGDYVLVSAPDLDIAGGAEDLLVGESAYLYSRGLAERTQGAEEQLVLTLRRKTPDEMGMGANQAALYEPALEALNSEAELSAAFAGLNTRAEFFGAYNQLLPEFTGAPLYLIVSTVDGASGAVGNRLDVARLVNGESAGLWAQEFLYYVDRDASLPAGAFSGHGFGFAAGVDRPWGPFDAVGVNVAVATNEMNPTSSFDDPMIAYTGGLGVYAGGGAGALFYDVSAGAAYDHFDFDRRIIIGTLDRSTSADWSGYHLNATARVGYNADLGWLQVQPVLSLDYLYLDESGYTESGGGAGFDLTVDGRTSDALSATGLVSFSHRFESGQTWWAPALRLGVRTESGSVGVTQARFAGFNSSFSLRPEGMPSTGVLLGFSVQGGTGFSALGFTYDADIRDGLLRHSGRVVVRLVF